MKDILRKLFRRRHESMKVIDTGEAVLKLVGNRFILSSGSFGVEGYKLKETEYELRSGVTRPHRILYVIAKSYFEMTGLSGDRVALLSIRILSRLPSRNIIESTNSLLPPENTIIVVGRYIFNPEMGHWVWDNKELNEYDRRYN